MSAPGWLPRPRELTRTLQRASWPRMLLGHRVTNGLAVGLGLGSLSLLMFSFVGLEAAASASVGMLVMSIGDQTAPAHGKLRQLSPLLWMAVLLWSAMQLSHLSESHATLLLGVLACFAGFLGMLGNAWGARGAPVGFALVLAAVFALSTPPPASWRVVLVESAWFECGAIIFAGYAVLSAYVLNNRYRAQALADALAELSAMLRQQAMRFAATADLRAPQTHALLGEQAALADKLQTARDLVLDTPASPRQQRLAAMLIAGVRLREQALACELALDEAEVRSTMTSDSAEAMETIWRAAASAIGLVCWSLYAGGRPSASTAERFDLAVQAASEHLPPRLREPVQAIADELHTLVRLGARSGEEMTRWDADAAEHWPRFRTAMHWPMAPLKRVFTPHSSVMRYALRVALAMALGYVVGEHLPWATHPQWILLTIAVVMRTNLAQTLERRNARLLGTTIGCLLVAGLLSLHPPVPLQFVIIALGAGVAHGFAQVRYLIAAIAATVLALLQGHLLHTATEFSLLERLADTFIGTTIAWTFSYVLPAWERRQLPALVKRLQAAHLRQAGSALSGPPDPTGNAEWRLARREVQDSLAALTVASQRALSEPLSVQPPLELLERLQVRSYRLLAQLSAVRLWREQPAQADATHAAPLLAHAMGTIESALKSPADELSTPSALHATSQVLTETLPRDAASGAGLPKRLQDAMDEARAVARELAVLLNWEQRRRSERGRRAAG